MKKPKPKCKDHILNEVERTKLLNACKTDTEKLAVYGLFYTGLRCNEFAHLNKKWYNEREQLIKIPLREKCSCYECKEPLHRGIYKKKDIYKDGKKVGEEKEKVGEKLVKPAGYFQVKTPDGERIIPIVPEIRGMLHAFFKKYKAVMSYIPNRIAIWKIVSEVGKRAGLKTFPHMLRATFSTILDEKGYSRNAIKRILGWRDLKMFEIYTTATPYRVKKEFAEKW